MAARYIDITNTFLNWHGAPTGIQRVVQGLSRNAAHSGFKLAVFHPAKQAWYEVSESTAVGTFEPGLLVQSNRRLKAVFARGPLQSLYRKLVQTVGLWAGRHGREQLLLRKGIPIHFCGGDRLYVVDANWDLPDFFPGLEREKKRAPGFDVIGMIYDVTPMTHPQFIEQTAFVEQFRRWIFNLMETSSWVVADSKDAAEEISRVFRGEVTPDGRFRMKLTENRLITHRDPPRAVRLGSKMENLKVPHPRPGAADLIGEIKRARLPITEEQEKALLEAGDERWGIFVGTMHPRKNLEVQIEALEPLWRAERIKMPLLWVGRVGSGMETLLGRITSEVHLRSKVIVLQGVPDALLGKLFGGARFSLYTSWAEGFGLPVSESLQLGCPVIASQASSIPEVAGRLVDYFDPKDASALRGWILRHLEDPTWNEEARRRALQFVPHSWADTLQDFAMEASGK